MEPGVCRSEGTSWSIYGWAAGLWSVSGMEQGVTDVFIFTRLSNHHTTLWNLDSVSLSWIWFDTPSDPFCEYLQHSTGVLNVQRLLVLFHSSRADQLVGFKIRADKLDLIWNEMERVPLHHGKERRGGPPHKQNKDMKRKGFPHQQRFILWSLTLHGSTVHKSKTKTWEYCIRVSWRSVYGGNGCMKGSLWAENNTSLQHRWKKNVCFLFFFPVSSSRLLEEDGLKEPCSCPVARIK